MDSIEKYGDSRSLSKLIEDLAKGAAAAIQPEACSILGSRSENSFVAEAEFQDMVEQITTYLKAMEIVHALKDGRKFPLTLPELYFALKEACELELNLLADGVNPCPSCNALNGPLPKYPDAGKNFEIFATMDNSLR